MAKEKFLIIATPMPDDCSGRFSETKNRADISAGAADPDDAYSWIEASFEIQLVRYREATHICSFTPSARYEWLANFFVGEPNEKWIDDGDPEGLEHESGGEFGGYGTYRDEYDPRFVVDTFTIDTMRDLPEPMRKPRGSAMMRSRDRMTPAQRAADERREAAHEAYLDAIWKAASEAAQEMSCNTDWSTAPILDVFTYRQWERECAERVRRDACERSKRATAFGVADAAGVLFHEQLR